MWTQDEQKSYRKETIPPMPIKSSHVESFAGKLIWTSKTARAYFCLSPRSLNRYIAVLGIPPTKIGTRIVYVFGPDDMRRLEGLIQGEQGIKSDTGKRMRCARPREK
jgi:hypothetical protein